jgi:hypothetical protein
MMRDGSEQALDADAPDTVRMSAAEATALGEQALKRVGYSGEDARIIVDQLVDNALCGYKFAGLPRILAIAGDEKTGKARTPVRIVHETPLSALMDGGNNVGYIVAYRAAEVAIRKAHEHGMASVGAYNSYYSGRNAYFVENVVKEGLVCLHIASAKPRAIPPGAARPALGTNPLCFGFPSDNGPVIFDMGTAALMWGDIMLHAHLGQPRPTPAQRCAAVSRPSADTKATASLSRCRRSVSSRVPRSRAVKCRTTVSCSGCSTPTSCCREASSTRRWRNSLRRSRRRRDSPVSTKYAFLRSARIASARGA